MSREYKNRGRDQIPIENIYGDVHIHGQPDRPRNEQVLLQAVGQEVVSRLEQSLHNAILINLDKEAQPEQVNRPWERELRIGLKPASPLPEDKTIAQIFDDPAIGGKLLILGQPGAGKTTTLLDLAKVLVDRAWQEINHPIPVLFNLSSWRDEKQPIREWMVAELRSKYGASGKLAQSWVEERQLLPLLDGLDEVAPERQEQCIIRINEFLQGEAAPLQVVVCSRLAEYENLNRQLQLNGAICLKALGDGQIQTYLGKVDRADLWQFLSQHSVLLEFVRAPLLLSVTVLAYPKHSEAQWQQLQTANDPLPFLLDAYVERMLHRQFESRAYRKRKAPTARETRHWLVWMARQMEERSQTEFLIEELQPSMLPKEQRWKERSFFWLVSWLIWGLSVGLIAGLSVGLSAGLSVGLFFGLSAGLIAGLSDGGLACIQHFTLRLVLYQNRFIPWNYAGFLNYSTERLFLQRVGGRYRFIHKLLQEHFAGMSGEC